MFDLEGKVVVITGGAKGIGAAAIRRFLDEGAKFVAIIDVEETSGIALERDLKKEHGEDAVKFFKCDVTNDVELFDVFNYTVEHYGCIDLVVNSAGISNDVKYKKQIGINFTAVVTSTLKALEVMRKDRAGEGGTIINISSITALKIHTTPTLYVYCGSKSAVLLFSVNLGMEVYYSHTGVRIITMCFGLTSTDIVGNTRCIDDFSNTIYEQNKKIRKIQTPEIAADGIIEAYKKGKSGSTWLVKGGEITDITKRVSKAYQIMSGEIQI